MVPLPPGERRSTFCLVFLFRSAINPPPLPRPPQVPPLRTVRVREDGVSSPGWRVAVVVECLPLDSQVRGQRSGITAESQLNLRLKKKHSFFLCIYIFFFFSWLLSLQMSCVCAVLCPWVTTSLDVFFFISFHYLTECLEEQIEKGFNVKMALCTNHHGEAQNLLKLHLVFLLIYIQIYVHIYRKTMCAYLFFVISFS